MEKGCFTRRLFKLGVVQPPTDRDRGPDCANICACVFFEAEA